MSTGSVGSSSANSTTTRQRMPGLASGFDTTSMVEALMSLERKPLEKLDIKKQTEQVKLQAYQALNTYLLKFRTSVSSLSSKKLWNAKSSVSSNEKSITATANEYAVKGSYNFRVAKLATATQYMSKGFADSKAPLVAQKEKEEPYKLGTINLNSAKTRVDNSAKVDDLNGCKGIFRGSVRITDANNNTSIIDLSACDTMDEVVRTLNTSDKALIKASIVDGAIQIEDNSRGSGTLRIQNVGTGTTATDLGIAGETEVGNNVLKGYNVFTLGEDMDLAMLNDGLGVEEGKFLMRVSNDKGFYELEIDTSGCKTVGDVIKRVNSTFDEKLKADNADQADKNGSLAPKDVLEGLRFGISEDKTSFGLTGVSDNHSYQFYQNPVSTVVGQATPAIQLGLTDGVKKALSGDMEVSFGRVLGTVDSPMLKTLGGVGGKTIGKHETISVDFNKDTSLKDLNEGKGLDLSRPLQMILMDGGSAAAGEKKSFEDILDHAELQRIYDGEMSQDGVTQYKGTVEELVNFINESIDKYARDPSKNAAGLIGLKVEIDPTEARLNFSGAQGGYMVECLGTMAANLGLTRYTAKVAGTDEYALQSSIDGYKKNATGIDYFYGLDSSYKSLIDGVELNLDPKKGDVSTLSALTGFHGITKNSGESDASYQARVNTAIQDLFSEPLSIVSREKVSLSTGELPYERHVSVDWNQIVVLDKDGNKVIKDNTDPLNPVYQTFADVDMSTMDVNTFMNSVNAAIQDGMDADNVNLKDRMKAVIDSTPEIPDSEKPGLKAEVDALDPDKLKTSAPKIDIHKLGTGFRWSNVNFNAEWEMSGKALDKLQLAKNTFQYVDDGTGNYVDNENYIQTMPTDAIVHDAKPEHTGTYKEEKVTEDTKLKELLYGVGITLTGLNNGDEDTLDFLFHEITVVENGKETTKKLGVSISLKELKEALLHDDNGNLGFDTSVKDYAKILDKLLQEKMTEFNAVNNTDYGMKIKFDEEGQSLALTDLKNVKSFDMTGAAANMLCTGFESFYVTEEMMEKLGDDPKITLANLTTATAHEHEIDGLGDIHFSIGNSTDIFKLKTAGTYKYANGDDVLDADGHPIEIKLDENSSLNELLTVFNKQMEYLSIEKDANGNPLGGNPALKSVRFTLNTSGTGIAVDNGSAARITFKDSTVDVLDDQGNFVETRSDASHLGQALGLVGKDGSDLRVESRSFYSCDSLGRNYVSRATSLEQFVGKNAELGTIAITNGYGETMGVVLDGCETIGDVLDAINQYKAKTGVEAIINDAGNGIIIQEDPKSTRYPLPTGNISVSDIGSNATAKKLGFIGEGKRESKHSQSIINGTLGVSIDVMSTDSLESVMYRLSESGRYKCAIINDGKSTNPYRLTVASSNTGEANDFVLDGDLLDFLGFSQTSRGSDGKVLYGDPNSAASPVMLSSQTNTNNTAILGVTLDLKSVSAEWTTITIDDDKERVAEEIKGMVDSYNELSELITYLSKNDEETGEPGIFSGDTTVRALMDDINEFFYMVYNPNNVSLGQVDKDGNQQTFTWMDIGVSLNASNTAADGTGSWYQTMEMDEDALTDFISNKWDILSKMLSNETNVSNVNLDPNVKPTGSFNGDLEDGFSVDGAINGDISKGGFGAANGIQAKGKIEDGNNEYTIWFQKPTTMSRMSIYHYSSETALKDFTLEYMDEQGNWQELRSIEGNKTDANHLGVASPTVMQALRIKASSTNAEDGKFRLLDIQVYEQGGLAGKLNVHTSALGDSQTGFLATQNTEINNSIRDINEQMERLQERLTSREEALWRRFSSMETILGQLDNQSKYLDNMMASMNASK